MCHSQFFFLINQESNHHTDYHHSYVISHLVTPTDRHGCVCWVQRVLYEIRGLRGLMVSFTIKYLFPCCRVTTFCSDHDWQLPITIMLIAINDFIEDSSTLASSQVKHRCHHDFIYQFNSRLGHLTAAITLNKGQSEQYMTILCFT
jgi:hypothetical protein